MQFTDRVRRAVVLAENQAMSLGHRVTGTEHLLLGLLADGESVAALVLASLGVSLEETRARVEEITGRGQGAPAGHLPFTPQAKKVLQRALPEAVQLGHSYIGTEHLLLALLAAGDGSGPTTAAKRPPDKPGMAKLGDPTRPRREHVVLASSKQYWHPRLDRSYRDRFGRAGKSGFNGRLIWRTCGPGYR